MACLFHFQALEGAFETTILSAPAKMVGESMCPRGQVEATMISLPFVYLDLMEQGELITKYVFKLRFYLYKRSTSHISLRFHELSTRHRYKTCLFLY